jgi:HlyD family secretion protein
MSRHTVHARVKSATAACLLLLAAACSKPEEKEPEPVVPVQTDPAQRSQIQRIVKARAILYPIDQAAVMPKISAPVRQFHVNRGDHVRRGQLLAELENRDLAAAVMESKGNLDQAEANLRSISSASLPDEVTRSRNEVQADKEALDAAQKVHESRKILFDQGALPRKQLDEAQVAYIQERNLYDSALKHLESLEKVGKEEQIKAARAQVEAARGRREGAEAQLEYSRIASPIAGVVADRPLYPGEMASAGMPLLTVIDVSRVVARASVPIDELRFCKVGDSATITAIDSGTELRGKVTVVSPALDPNSTTAEVWVLAPNLGERLRPGSTVEVAIVTETILDALVIPAAALLPSPEGTGNSVLVVGADFLARRRTVEIGIRQPTVVQVLKGLDRGEQVVTVGGLGVEDETKVKVENESAGKNDKNDEPKPKE